MTKSDMKLVGMLSASAVAILCFITVAVRARSWTDVSFSLAGALLALIVLGGVIVRRI